MSLYSQEIIHKYVPASSTNRNVEVETIHTNEKATPGTPLLLGSQRRSGCVTTAERDRLLQRQNMQTIDPLAANGMLKPCVLFARGGRQRPSLKLEPRTKPFEHELPADVASSPIYGGAKLEMRQNLLRE
jgi:hypothetical protein